MGTRKIITPFIPFILAAIGFHPLLGLHSPITGWPTGETSYFFAFLIAALIWLVFEIVFVMKPNTRIEDLALDCFLQTVVAIIFAALGGYFLAGGEIFGRNALEWWFAIPMGVAVLDAIVSNAYIVTAVGHITSRRGGAQSANSPHSPGAAAKQAST